MNVFLILINVACLCHIISTQSDVRLPPTLTRWPSEKKILQYEGSVLILQCGAKGKPSIRYEWKKNGFQLNTNTSRISKGSGGKITINGATETDEGYYQCFAKNQYGTALSNMIQVQVTFNIPPKFTAGHPTVLQKTALEGMPFHIQADRRRSSFGYCIDWYSTAAINEDYFGLGDIRVPVKESKRINVAENGDLHFAYVIPEDGGRIYRQIIIDPTSNTENATRTQLTVTRKSSGNISQVAPTLAFSSEAQTVANIGQPVGLICFFYGYPEPKISWSRPPTRVANEGYRVDAFDTNFVISKITASDEGNYSCTGSNAQGNNTHTFQLRVKAEPEFKNTTDGPYNINKTEGDSVTFNCNAFAIPEANIVWLQNGYPIHTDNPPKRFVFSNDNKSLTIRDVCRDCVDRESKTDLMVIQCNASNVHGYAFAQGYLNVLTKTKVAIRGSENVSVDFLKEKQFVFQCYATSDPSTPPTVRWYKTEPFGDLVRSEPPYIYVTMDILVIMAHPNCSSACAKYLGEYRCIGDNGYSRGSDTITLSYKYMPSSGEQNTEEKDTWAVWKIILVAGATGLVPFIVGIVLHFRWKRRFGDVNSQTIDRRMPNPVSIYEDVGYDSIGRPLEEIVGSNKRPMTRESGGYEHIGYDSIDQVLEEIGNIGYTMPNSLDLHGHNGYESLDVPEREAIGTGGPMLDKDITCDDMGYLMPLEEITNGERKDQQQVNNCNESVPSESNKIPKSNEQSESSNTNSNLNREEVNPNLNLEKSDTNPEKVNSHSHWVSKEVNPILALSTNELNQCLDLDSKERDSYMDLDHEPREASQYTSLDLKEVNDYLDLSPKEVNEYLDLYPN